MIVNLMSVVIADLTLAYKTFKMSVDGQHLRSTTGMFENEVFKEHLLCAMCFMT